MRTDQKLFLLKCLLTMFLVTLWIVGSIVFGALAWVRFGYVTTKEFLEHDQSMGLVFHYNILIYMGLGDGGLIVLFSIFGLIGGLRRIKCALVMYLIALLLAFGLTIAVCVYGFIHRKELMIQDLSVIQDMVQEEYSGNPDDGFTRVIDAMQSEFACCGGDSPRDFILSSWHQADTFSRNDMVPGSCCKDYLQHKADPDVLCPIWKMGQDGQPLKSEYNDNLQQEGCEHAMISYFDQYFLIVIIVAVAYGVLQLICLTVLIILIHVLNSLYIPQAEEIVYDMARNQEKSPYPSRGDYKEYYT